MIKRLIGESEKDLRLEEERLLKEYVELQRISELKKTFIELEKLKIDLSKIKSDITEKSLLDKLKRVEETTLLHAEQANHILGDIDTLEKEF